MTTNGGSAGTAGAGFRADPQPGPQTNDVANQRRLAWFSDDELMAEIHRRLITPPSNGASR